MLNKLKCLFNKGRNYLKTNKKSGGGYVVEIIIVIIIGLLLAAAVSSDTGSGGGIETIWTNMKTGITNAITKATAHFQ